MVVNIVVYSEYLQTVTERKAKKKTKKKDTILLYKSVLMSQRIICIHPILRNNLAEQLMCHFS